MSKQESLEQAQAIFTAFLMENKQRKTPERFAILEEIYDRQDHFDAEDLFVQMRNKNFNVSRATVYNTLDLLLNCELVKKHQFGSSQALYEKAHGFKQHDHMICVDCAKIIEFCDPRIQQIKSMMTELFDFKVSHHSLNLYGSCSQCSAEKTGKEKGAHGVQIG